jgi:hypothetical protein
MMVIVADTIFETRRRAGRLNATDQTFGDQDVQRVVDRLKRDRANFAPHCLSDCVGRDMGRTRDRTQHRQSLRRYLNAVLSKQVGRVSAHMGTISNNGVIPKSDRNRGMIVRFAILAGWRQPKTVSYR